MMIARPHRVRLIAVLVAWLAASPAQAQEAPGIPTPEEFFGFAMGTEQQLAGWSPIVEYFQLVADRSERVVVQELGRTTMDNPYIMAIISTPEAIGNLDAHRAMQKRLADPRITTPEEADRIAREGKAVLLVGVNVHSTEIGTSQMVNDLLYRLATEDSPWVRHVLENVILLLIPSQNPDGQQMVVDWHYENLGTPYEDSPLPELYHKYTGHDNNRDSYMLTQIESQLLARVTYKDWLPEVYLDKHQMGSNRARIWVPPFTNPANPNIDPLIWSQVNLLGQTMAARLHEEGKIGVIWGEHYTGFWQGANSTTPWWHNMVALLTEVASSRMASTLYQEFAASAPPRDGRPAVLTRAERDAGVPLPPPTDVQPRMNYPQPWLGGPWTFADVVEYQLISTLGLLEGVANNREMLKRNFYRMNQRTIELFANGSPYAYLVPPDQHDPLAAATLLQLVQAGGGEVHRAGAPFAADGEAYPAGTHVLLLAQPFGRWIKDLLEPQTYPEIRSSSLTGAADRPYDVTAWSLGMLMGVETVLVEEPFDAELELLVENVAFASGELTGNGSTFILPQEVNLSAIAVNRLLQRGIDVSRARAPLEVDGVQHAPGALLVRGVPHALMAELAEDLGLRIQAADVQPGAVLPLTEPRLGLYEPWGGNMDAGWTRWILEQHEFRYTHLRNADMRTGDLAERFDVIILPEMTATQLLRGNMARNVRPEYRAGIGDEGVQTLRQFVRNGGTLITLGNAAQFAIDSLGAPFRNVVHGAGPESFFCPGSILRIAVDTAHPIGYGMPEQADAMFINNGGYVLNASSTTAGTIVARYPEAPLLRSGWIVGEARLRGTGAVLEAPLGRGRIIMHTFRVQNRAQTWGTFKLLFNSIFYGAALSGRSAPEPTAFEAANY